MPAVSVRPIEAAPPRRAATLARGAGLLPTGAILLLLIVVSTWVGAKDLQMIQVWHALWSDDGSYATQVVRDLRLPRTMLAVLVGAALGLAGALMQAVTRNPLADPGLLGVNAGASAAVVFAIGVLGIGDYTRYVWFAMAGAAAAVIVVSIIGLSGSITATPVRLALAGAAISACLSGVIAGLTAGDAATFDHLRFWMVGSFGGQAPDVAWLALPFLAVGAIIALSLSGSLNAVALGDDTARALGAGVLRTRVLSVAAVTLLCGASTAAVGPIGFVGLVVPLMVRSFVGPNQRWILPYSMVVAPCLLLSADIIGRVSLPTGELEAGAVTAAIGAPVFIWMVRRRRVMSL